MDKVTMAATKTTRVTHNFYCDECGEFIGSVSEYDDGYYPDPKETVELKIYLSTWLTYRKHLCEKCRCKKMNELMTLLRDFGFRRDGEDSDES